MNNPTILITGFVETLGQNLKRQLIPQGFDIIEANSMENVISSFENRRPDLVIKGFFQKNINDSLKGTKEIRRRDLFCSFSYHFHPFNKTRKGG